MRSWLPIAGIVLLAGCSRDPSHRLQALVPGLDPELARAIAAGDSALVRYGYDKGNHDVRNAARDLESTVHYETEAAYRRSLEAVREPIERIYRVLGDSFHMPGLPGRWHLCAALPYEQAAAFHTLSEQVETLRHTPLTGEERGLEARKLMPGVEAIDPLSDAAIYLDIQMAQVMDEDSLYTEELRFYRRGLSRARARGPTPFLPTMLMHVGFVLGKISDSDSTWIYYEQARELAERMRWANAAIRANRLMAGWQRAHGHLARAYELTTEAQEAALEFRGGSDAWYGLRTALDINLDLGAWNVVADLVARGEAINRRWPPDVTSRHHDSRAEDVPWFRGPPGHRPGKPGRGEPALPGDPGTGPGAGGPGAVRVPAPGLGPGAPGGGAARAGPAAAPREGATSGREKNLPSGQRTRLIPSSRRPGWRAATVTGAAASLAGSGPGPGDGPFVQGDAGNGCGTTHGHPPAAWAGGHAAAGRRRGRPGPPERHPGTAWTRRDRVPLPGLQPGSARGDPRAPGRRPGGRVRLRAFWRSLYRRLGRSGDGRRVRPRRRRE